MTPRFPSVAVNCSASGRIHIAASAATLTPVQPRAEHRDSRPKSKIAGKQVRTRSQQESERQDQQVGVPRTRQEIRDAQQIQTKPGRQRDGERRTRTAGPRTATVASIR